MKGTIVRCLEEVVRDNFGDEKWEEILTKTGHDAEREFESGEDVPDGDAVKMIGTTAEVLGISVEQAMEAFGIHWSTTYAPSIYDSYFQKAKNAREFMPKTSRPNTTAVPPSAKVSDTPSRMAESSMPNMPRVRISGLIRRTLACSPGGRRRPRGR
ncbi:MAG: heme NO-binding domain-containing protein [Myxococcota bacterium]